MIGNVLITGAGGYIGSAAVRRLKERGYSVLTARRDAAGDFIMEFARPREIAEMDVPGIDAVVHLVSPKESLLHSDPDTALAEGLLGIRAILNFCVRNGIPRFVYLSSFHVLGIESGSADENSIPAPKGDYGMAHFLAEQAVAQYTRTGRIKGSVLRASNVYGMPWPADGPARWELIPFSFCRDAATDSRIMLKTDGAQRRNFVHLNNVVDCIAALLEHPELPLLHCFGPQTPTVREFAELVCRVAFEALGREVVLVAPTAQREAAMLDFHSRYPEIDQSGQQTLEDYVRDMCLYLNAMRCESVEHR